MHLFLQIILKSRRTTLSIGAASSEDVSVRVVWAQLLAEVAEDADGDERAEGNGVSDAADVAEGVEVAENAEDAEVVQEEAV
ncbi:hypothetical protein PV325_008158 [Microctonus aethiopoides]|nr:hypothetical protein PV325_008158 [Microctonus aethiopoides]